MTTLFVTPWAMGETPEQARRDLLALLNSGAALSELARLNIKARLQLLDAHIAGRAHLQPSTGYSVTIDEGARALTASVTSSEPAILVATPQGLTATSAVTSAATSTSSPTSLSPPRRRLSTPAKVGIGATAGSLLLLLRHLALGKRR